MFLQCLTYLCTIELHDLLWQCFHKTGCKNLNVKNVLNEQKFRYDLHLKPCCLALYVIKHQHKKLSKIANLVCIFPVDVVSLATRARSRNASSNSSSRITSIRTLLLLLLYRWQHWNMTSKPIRLLCKYFGNDTTMVLSTFYSIIVCYLLWLFHFEKCYLTFSI